MEVGVVLRTKNWLNLSLTITLLSFIYLPANAAENNYTQQLIQYAQEKHLASRPEWLKLLHYKPTLLGGYKSQVDAPQFFNAPDGKTDPNAELEATLRAFFKPLPESEDEQQLQPQCLFVARYHWLKKELQFDPDQLAEYQCKRFEEWMAALNPKGMTLIFPTAFVNSPASMFGHTFIRVDTKNQTEKTRLLSYALNFAADTGNDGGLAYAVKGLMGGYPGGFSVLPYYLKVREYSDMENREIWEYQLNLTEADTYTVLEHAWELRGIWFDYFFFSENCSYHLLSLLETARPELQLTDDFPAWTIPSDTIRTVEKADLVSNITYRPSRGDILKHRLEGVSRPQIKQIVALGDNQLSTSAPEVTKLEKEEQALLLELAHEYAAYKQEAGDSEDSQHAHNLLKVRSTLDVTLDETEFPVPEIRPEEGHKTGRIALYGGTEGHHAFQAIELRPAYHDLLDPQPGYTKGAQLHFFEIALRHNQESGKSYVKSITPVEIFSLSPITPIETPISWRFNFSFRHKDGLKEGRLLTSINGGGGLSYPLGEEITAYALATLGVDTNRELTKGYSAGLGTAFGITTHPSQQISLHLFWDQGYYKSGYQHHEKLAGLEQRISINHDNSLRIKLLRRQELSTPFNEYSLGWHHYF